MDKNLLEILCCPASRVPVRPARRDELDVLNGSIAAGGVVTVAGGAVEVPLEEALITRDGKVIYRVDAGIPVMLIDEGIGTLQLNEFPA
ncbi:MAG: Trm112 family protein [Dokdonella sp.]